MWASQRNEEDAANLVLIYQCIHGVVFLGTTHRESRLSGLGVAAVNTLSGIGVNSELGLVRALAQNSEILERINKAFLHVRGDLMIHSFYEELAMSFPLRIVNFVLISTMSPELS